MKSRKPRSILNRILLELYRSGKKSMSEIVKILSEEFGVSERTIYSSAHKLRREGFIESKGMGIRGSPRDLILTEKGETYMETISSEFGEDLPEEISPNNLCNMRGDIVAEAFRCGLLRKIGKKIFLGSIFDPELSMCRRALRCLD